MFNIIHRNWRYPPRVLTHTIPHQRLWSLLLLSLSISISPATAQLMSPEEALGFKVGSDYQVAGWQTVSTYLRHVADNSPRVEVEELGKTTDGNDFIMVLISAPETLKNRAGYQAIQQRLAKPKHGESDELNALSQEGKTVVLINCNLHSTELASSQMAMEFTHQFAIAETPEMLSILENVIILLIPSANPDGLNIVVDWYNRNVGTPYEGAELP